ncbi:MAG: glycoside hydrolase N-terminal domain-containing protein [Tepidisphaeraceae bacterium]
MPNLIGRSLFALTVVLSLHDVTRAASDVAMWYRQPAQKWVEALPLGNGRLGAMVFGGVQRERIG